MTFEEWWNTYLYLGDDLDKELAQVAWEAGAESVVNSKLIPEGYVVVPKEPTTAMEEAFLDIYERRGWFMRGYKNMIQAAQEPES